jgi:predicted metal-binding protein
MNNEIITVNGREYALYHSSVNVEVKELIHRYRDTEKFIVYCKECNRYNACHACPPFDFDTGEYLASHQTATIIGTKIMLDKEIIDTHQGRDKCTKISYEIIGTVRTELDNMLLQLEEQYPESKAFFAGSCRICPIGECTKIAGKPCISPEKIRPSLEALGFDVSRISAEVLNIEMKWSRDGILPEYFTLVSGFFTDKEINIV